MPPSTGLRDRKKRRTRRAIQRAALELFAAQGYRETTIAQIADAAEVSLRTVTLHFPVKEDLVLALGADGLDDLIQRIALRPEGERTLDALRTWIAEQIALATDTEHGNEGRELLRLRHQVTTADPELQARVRGSDLRIEQTLAGGIARDLDLPPDALAPRLAASAVVTGIRTITEPLLSDQDLPSAEDTLILVDHTIAFARAGLGALTAP
jgi:AcrR family transcriptional regulator